MNESVYSFVRPTGLSPLRCRWWDLPVLLRASAQCSFFLLTGHLLCGSTTGGCCCWYCCSLFLYWWTVAFFLVWSSYELSCYEFFCTSHFCEHRFTCVLVTWLEWNRRVIRWLYAHLQKKVWTLLQRGWTIWHSHQQNVEVSVLPHFPNISCFSVILHFYFRHFSECKMVSTWYFNLYFLDN